MADKEKTRLQREWEEIRPHFKWEVVKILFGGGVAAAFYAIIRSAANETVSLLWFTLIFIVSSVGYAAISLYLRSQRDRIHGKSTGMFTAMIIYLPILVGLGFCVWAYFVGSTLYRLNHESQSLRSNLDLYVKPRTATQEQITAIAAYLSQYDPQQIKVLVVANDAEASNYMGQVMGGLIQGGWKILGTGYVEQQMNQGISINVEQTGQPQNPDPKHPTPQDILKRALEAGKIVVSGGGSAYSRPAYSITIAFGPRQLIIDSTPPVRPKIPPPPGWQ
jgi:hypothetical protein